MRAALVSIALIAMAAQPALAQGKTKAPKMPQGVAALEVCETFGSGDIFAVETATAAGWDAYDQSSDNPYVRSYGASKDMAGLGMGELYALVETYPDATLGYCRIDVVDMDGDGAAQVQAIQDLERYEGQSIVNADGSFGSLKRNDGTDAMLLVEGGPDRFVIQLTTITPKAEPAD